MTAPEDTAAIAAARPGAARPGAVERPRDAAQPLVPARLVAPEDFPACELSAPGMRTIDAVDEPRYGVIHLNVPYAEKSGVVRHLQILLPPRAASWPDDADDRYPAVLYVQGSAFMEQQLGLEMANLAGFAARGYVVAIVQYRGTGIAPFPAQAKDAKTAVRWLREHAGEYHVDPDRMAMWGDSSGGHTTLMTYATGTAGADDDPAYSDEPVDVELGLRAFVDYYGPTHIGRMNESSRTTSGPTPPRAASSGACAWTSTPSWSPPPSSGTTCPRPPSAPCRRCSSSTGTRTGSSASPSPCGWWRNCGPAARTSPSTGWPAQTTAVLPSGSPRCSTSSTPS